MSNRTCSVSDCPTDMTGKYLRKSYCEKHYYSWRKYGTPTPTSHQRRAARKGYSPEPGNCVQCSTEFLRTNQNSKYCSDICRSWAAFLGPGKSKHCSDCGDPMTASRSSKTGPGRCAGCSQHGSGGYKRGCRCEVCVAAKRDANMAYKAKVKAEHGVGPSTLFKRHYRERTGVSYRATPKDWIDPKLRLKLYERDDWLCHLCKEPVDRSAHFNDDFAPSLDHLKPRSKGGSDEPGNLKTSHRICNATRRDDELDALEVV